MRLLVVEDEEQLASVIADGLRQLGFAVDVALDGTEALDKAWNNNYEVVVLDRDLPGVHGDDVCRQLLKQESSARILMLTASGELEQRVDGLSLGADDYLPKPFAFSELVARVRALSRRPGGLSPPVISRASVVLDAGKMIASRGGRPLKLTRKEFGVLEHLLRAEGGVVSAEVLLERVWDEHADPFTNAVRITVGTLRRKLGKPALIETVIGSGYRIAQAAGLDVDTQAARAPVGSPEADHHLRRSFPGGRRDPSRGELHAHEPGLSGATECQFRGQVDVWRPVHLARFGGHERHFTGCLDRARHRHPKSAARPGSCCSRASRWGSWSSSAHSSAGSSRAG